jgi:predicted small secreted protein
MKRTVYSLVIAAAFLLAACGGNKDTANTAAGDSLSVQPDSAKAASQYTCPMHPEVVSDQPGKCPTCGMDLEIKS